MPLKILFEAPTLTEMALAIIQNQAQSAQLKDIEWMLTDLEQFNSIVVSSGPSGHVYLKDVPEWSMGTPHSVPGMPAPVAEGDDE